MKKLSFKEVKERLADGLQMRNLSLRQIKKRCVNCLVIGMIITVVGAVAWGYTDVGGWSFFGGIALMLYGVYANFKLRCPYCKEVLNESLYRSEEVCAFCPYCGERLDWDAK